eukprot:XP_012826004.1 PREDICTED: uncharacterized protein LOC779912 isoform X2 [Xenopus tropicalis]
MALHYPPRWSPVCVWKGCRCPISGEALCPPSLPVGGKSPHGASLTIQIRHHSPSFALGWKNQHGVSLNPFRHGAVLLPSLWGGKTNMEYRYIHSGV